LRFVPIADPDGVAVDDGGDGSERDAFDHFDVPRCRVYAHDAPEGEAADPEVAVSPRPRERRSWIR
jgi:hypothetical protein